MNKIDFSTKRINWTIVLISVLLMLVVLNFPFRANRFGDATFHVESKNLALYLKGEVAADKVMITKAPGPILFYTPVYLLAAVDANDDRLWVYAVVFTFIIGMISLLLIFRIGTTFFSKEVGLLSVLLFFAFPIHCYYSLGILAEMPAFFSLALAIYGWSIAFEDPDKKKGWILLSLGMWLLILNRPNAILLLGVLFLVIVYSFFKNKTFYATYGKKLSFTFLTVLILGMGTLQLARSINGNESGGSQESYFYYVAHIGRFQFREEPTDLRFWESDNRPDSKDYQSWIRSGGELDAVMAKTKRTYNTVYSHFIIGDMLEHPFWTARQFVIRCFYGHINIISKVQPDQFDLGPFKGSLGYWTFLFIINSINLLVLVGAVLFLYHEKNLIQYWIFWGISVALLIFHGLTYMEPRYMFPSKVALYSMSAAGLYRIPLIKKIIDKISIHVFPIAKPVR
ncbi:glycosyltransferase family protein [Flavobacterium soyangense]|uniref:Glycosyltransferase family 39 protein n=1 Tax=Flavobacterium soyangense TaxID=2023265 RepID=A0A930UBH2_9FLAO|nr:glycosyltransferase family 39 protein [Flavobacterium soyangense]MBF2708251.1 glycosyltransferase family 39 protein [Flavobacterium soyangense]